VLKGSGGSGKSEEMFQKAILRLLSEPGHRMYGIRKVGKTIRNSCWQLLKDIIYRHDGLSQLFNFRETDMRMECKINDNSWQGIGMDDREKLKSITSPTAFQIEEATELDEDDLNQIIIRMRGHTPHYKQVTMAFNPIDENHWIRGRFFPQHIETKIKKDTFAPLPTTVQLDEKTKVTVNALICHTTYKDNNFLTNEDKARLEMFKNINPQHYRIYALGEWGLTEGLVYPNGYKMIPKAKYPSRDECEIVYGLDFGFVDPISLSRYYLKKKQVPGGEVLQSYCEELILMRELDIRPDEPIYADHNAPDKIEQLQNVTSDDGYHLFNVIKAEKDVKAGIDALRNTERFSCSDNVNHNREIKTYRLQMDTRGHYKDYEPIKYADHTQDNERYAIYTHSKLPEVRMAFI
jgi:phage terminase large subunit